MSFLTTLNTSGSGINSLATNLSNLNLTNLTNSCGISISNSTGLNNNSYDSYYSRKVTPAFKLELYKAENDGFVMYLMSSDGNTYKEKTKMFILNDIQNMGKDIQNILTAEVLKS